MRENKKCFNKTSHWFPESETVWCTFTVRHLLHNTGSSHYYSMQFSGSFGKTSEYPPRFDFHPRVENALVINTPTVSHWFPSVLSSCCWAVQYRLGLLNAPRALLDDLQQMQCVVWEYPCGCMCASRALQLLLMMFPVLHKSVQTGAPPTGVCKCVCAHHYMQNNTYIMI